MRIAQFGSVWGSVARIAAMFGMLHAACLSVAQTWGTFQGNIGHTGFSPVQVDPTNFSQLWRSQLGGAFPLLQPSAGGGAVYVSNSLGQASVGALSLFAVDGAAGTIDWAHNYTRFASLTSPALYNGNLYFQTVNMFDYGVIHCFSTAGAVVWEQPFATQRASFLSPTLDSNLCYFVGGTNGGLYEFGSAAGDFDWFSPQVEQTTQWTPALDATLAYAYLGANSHGIAQAGLYAVNRADGSLAYQIADPGFIVAASNGQAVALSGTMAYVTNANRLIAFDLLGHTIAWQQNRACTGQPDVVGNVVYVSDGGTLSAFNAATGVFMWAWTSPGGSVADNIVVANNIAFVTDTATTYGIDLATHQQVWSTAAGGNLAIADGNLYIAGATGSMTAVGLNLLQLSMPSGYQLARGIPLSGGFTSMLYSDGQALKALPGPTINPQEAPVQVILTGTSLLASPIQMKFHLQSFASEPGLTQTFEMWNYRTSSWVLLGRSAATTTDSSVDVDVLNPFFYMNAGGQMQARLSWRALGPLLSYPWSIGIDQAVWLEG